MIDFFSEKVLRKYPELAFIANDISRTINDGYREELLYEKIRSHMEIAIRSTRACQDRQRRHLKNSVIIPIGDYQRLART